MHLYDDPLFPSPGPDRAPEQYEDDAPGPVRVTA